MAGKPVLHPGEASETQEAEERAGEAGDLRSRRGAVVLVRGGCLVRHMFSVTGLDLICQRESGTRIRDVRQTGKWLKIHPLPSSGMKAGPREHSGSASSLRQPILLCPLDGKDLPDLLTPTLRL